MRNFEFLKSLKSESNFTGSDLIKFCKSNGSLICPNSTSLNLFPVKSRLIGPYTLKMPEGFSSAQTKKAFYRVIDVYKKFANATSTKMFLQSCLEENVIPKEYRVVVDPKFTTGSSAAKNILNQAAKTKMQSKLEALHIQADTLFDKHLEAEKILYDSISSQAEKYAMSEKVSKMETSIRKMRVNNAFHHLECLREKEYENPRENY